MDQLLKHPTHQISNSHGILKLNSRAGKFTTGSEIVDISTVDIHFQLTWLHIGLCECNPFSDHGQLEEKSWKLTSQK